MLAMLPCALAQQDTPLPDNFDKLIEMKQGLLKEFAAQNKAGDADASIDTLRVIVSIHRKALTVAKNTGLQQNLVDQLQDTFLTDGQYLANQLFIRRNYTDSGKLRRQLHEVLAAAGADSEVKAQSMLWMAVSAEKMATASKEQQDAYIAAATAADAVDEQQYALAESAYQALLDAEVPIFGEEHLNVAEHLSKLGWFQLQLKKYKLAEPTFKRSLTAREAVSGRDLSYAVTLFNLARTCQETERFEDAETHYLAVAEIEESILGSTNDSFHQTLRQLQRLYQLTGNTEKLAAIGQRITAAAPASTVLAHLPAQTVAAALMEPSKLTDDPKLELLPFEIIKAFGMDEMGFDPLSVRAAAAFVTVPEGNEVNFGFVFLEKDGTSVKFPWANANAQMLKFRGATYVKQGNGSPTPWCAAEFENEVIVVGTEGAVKQCMANRATSATREMLMAKRGQGHVVAAVDVNQLRPLLQAAMVNAPPAPPAIENLKSLADTVNAVQLQIDLSSRIGLTLETSSDQAAQQASTVITEALGFATELAQQQIDRDIQQETPVQAATAAYAKRIALRYLKALQPQTEATTVKIQFEGLNHAVGPVMAGLLIPAVQAARDAARRTRDRNSMKQLALAMHNYLDVHERFPAQATLSADGKPLLSWRVAVLPFLEEQELFDQFHHDEPWDSEHNLKIAQQMPAVYRNDAVSAPNQTVVQSFVGKGAFFDGPQGARFADFTDGSSNSLMLVEANADQAVVWTKPADLNFDPAEPGRGVGSLRGDGFMGVMADGSVRFIGAEIDAETLRRIITKNDGQVVGEF